MSECEVCCGEGSYPIINRYGRELYAIKCPECFGDCRSLVEEPKPDDIDVVQVAKYNLAMLEKRAREDQP